MRKLQYGATPISWTLHCLGGNQPQPCRFCRTPVRVSHASVPGVVNRNAAPRTACVTTACAVERRPLAGNVHRLSVDRHGYAPNPSPLEANRVRFDYGQCFPRADRPPRLSVRTSPSGFQRPTASQHGLVEAFIANRPISPNWQLQLLVVAVRLAVSKLGVLTVGCWRILRQEARLAKRPQALDHRVARQESLITLPRNG